MPKQSLMQQVSDLLDELREVDFSIPEDTGYFSIEDDLVRRVRTLTRRAADLMRDAMECYEAEAAAGETEEDIDASDDQAFLKEIGAQISSRLAVEEVSGLAFVSRGQLLDILAALDNAARAKQIWKVASHADTALRRSGRALIALESAMRECEGLPFEFRQWQDLDDSLEVRRIYSQFRRAVLNSGAGADLDRWPEDPEALTERLKRAANRIAVLRNLEIYPFLRIDDRLPIRRLQKRIQAWLAAEGDHSPSAGAQLWSDLVSFARLLSQINLREELREHDRLVVDTLWRKFFADGDGPTKLSPSNLSLFEPLLGREDDLDHIILHPSKHGGQDLKPPLERLRKELGKPFETAPIHTGWVPSP